MKMRTSVSATMLALAVAGSQGCASHLQHLNLDTQKVESLEISDLGILIVDMQDKFLERAKYEQEATAIENQIDVIEFATKNNIPVFVLEYRPDGDTDQRLTKVLQKHGNVTYISKRHDDGFQSTLLDDMLKAQDITNLYIMGLNKSACVKRTMKGGIKKGYNFLTSEDVLLDAPINCDGVEDKEACAIYYTASRERVDRWFGENSFRTQTRADLVASIVDASYETNLPRRMAFK